MPPHEVQVENGEATAVEHLGNGAFSITVMPQVTEGLLTVSIPAGMARDIGGNLNAESNSIQVVVPGGQQSGWVID